jgi:hypothetical protein
MVPLVHLQLIARRGKPTQYEGFILMQFRVASHDFQRLRFPNFSIEPVVPLDRALRRNRS